jgi:hypothetical protein
MQPTDIYWCDGSEEEYQALVLKLVLFSLRLGHGAEIERGSYGRGPGGRILRRHRDVLQGKIHNLLEGIIFINCEIFLPEISDQVSFLVPNRNVNHDQVRLNSEGGALRSLRRCLRPERTGQEQRHSGCAHPP